MGDRFHISARGAAAFHISPDRIGLSGLLTGKEEARLAEHAHQPNAYADLKKAQGELMEYYVQLPRRLASQAELTQANRWMQSVQEAMHAAKDFKDIQSDRQELLQSGNDFKFGQFERFGEGVRLRLHEVVLLLQSPGTGDGQEGIVSM